MSVSIKEESPYKPDTVKGWIFERKITFARYFCPFLIVIKCHFLPLYSRKDLSIGQINCKVREDLSIGQINCKVGEDLSISDEP
jgi:hypothetical protein